MAVYVAAAWLLAAILIPAAVLLVHLDRSTPKSVEVGPPVQDADKEGRPRRAAAHKDALVSSPGDHVKTMYDLLAHSAKRFPTGKGFGFRKVIKVHEEEKEIRKKVHGEEKKEIKVWKYFELGSYEWLTYKEAAVFAKTLGSGLRVLGLQRGQRLLMFAPSSRNWMLISHGCFCQAMSIVTAYDTLGEEGLRHALAETKAPALFTSSDHLPLIAKVAPDSPHLKYVIYTGDSKAEVLDKMGSLKVVAFDELKKMGEGKVYEVVRPEPSDTACIMYTSGSTGKPKGVVLTHANIVAGVAGAMHLIQPSLFPDRDVYLAYLPLAHILEFLVENLAIFAGIPLGYGTVKTLTDASVRNCKGDLNELRPTLMAGVPAVWETIRKGVLGKLSSLPPVQRAVFYGAFHLKWALMHFGLPTDMVDKVVFNKIREQTGGRLRFALSGGAPIPPDTQKFLSVTVCPIIQGYGLTETCGICTVLPPPPSPLALERVGAPIAAVEIKLVDVPDTSYSHRNKPKPQGEIWVRGPAVMKGYFERDDLTKEVMTPDGWFMTGDIGEWHLDGTLSIIDRRKNLVKLAHGEYVALEKLESIYQSNEAVGHCCVIANSHQAYVVAVAVPHEKALRRLVSDETTSFHDLCTSDAAKKAVLKSLRETGQSSGLKGGELLGGIVLTPDEWTPESGLLTAAMKMKRQEVAKRWEEDIKKLWEQDK